MLPRTALSKLQAAAALGATVLCAVAGPAPLLHAVPAAAQTIPEKLSAIYKIRFAGLNLGDFKVWSNVADGKYSIEGQGKIKFLTGMIFEIKGESSSSGKVSGKNARPVPDAFSFTFNTKKKQGYLLMKFTNGAVAQVASQPPLRSHPKAIQVTAKHVDGVLDPLTALFFAVSATRPGDHGSVCDRTVAVYDGKYRFDLQLSHKKTVKVLKKGKSGYNGPAAICRVKFVPVAGHRPHASNMAFMSNTNDIEVWMMPLPQSNMYAPYHISVPTPYGTAQATARSFHVETANHQKTALVQ